MKNFLIVVFKIEKQRLDTRVYSFLIDRSGTRKEKKFRPEIPDLWFEVLFDESLDFFT